MDVKPEVTTAATHTLAGHSDWVHCVAVLPDGRIVSGSSDHALKIWPAAPFDAGEIITATHTVAVHSAPVRCVAVLPNGRIVSSSDKTLIIIPKIPEPV